MKTVARRLVNFCLAWALVLGFGWGGVLAAAVCPHLGCETDAAAPGGNPSQDEHSSGECHNSDDAEEHSAQTKAHQGHAAELPVEKQTAFESLDLKRFFSGSSVPSCSHCIGRPDAPPSPKLEPQTNTVRNAGKEAPPHASLQTLADARTYVRQITPSQHAPPGRSDRHLLHSVFRI
ncbi:MAG TPA: hypothetical protein VGB73_05635 [Pyrinomonadaceae bacterium]